MSEHWPIVILGGGLTGLSAACHLEPLPSVVLEREAEVGGLCRSHEENGFIFDCTGHLLHLRHVGVRGLVERLLPGALTRHERRALIFSEGVYTPYPFQANLHGLPLGVVRECISGFVEAMLRSEREGEPDRSRLTFRQWTEAAFGRGIASHFLLPYNAKLWLTDLDEIDCSWVSWSIPRPTLRQVLDGAFGATVNGLGYNPTFLYPERGGIRILPEALAARCSAVRLEERVKAVDAGQRRVRLASGEALGYEVLISTLPLDRLLSITSGLPEDLPAAGERLRSVRVLNLSLGIDRPRISSAHWIYFPEPEFSFYRIGFPGNMSPHVVPRGCSSIYVERSLRRDETFDEEEVAATAVDELRRSGVLWRGDRIVYRRASVLDPAYVIHDAWRARNLPRVLEVLREAGIHSAGRFGAWEYSSMEGALLSGIDLAARIAPAFAGRYRRARAAGS